MQKYVIRHAASDRLTGGDVGRKMNAAEDAAAGDFVRQRGKAVIAANHIWRAAEIDLKLHIVAFVKEREQRPDR